MELIRADRPMSLGSHLDELRRAIIFPLIIFVVAFIVAFAFQSQLKVAFVRPLLVAMEWCGDEVVQKAGLPLDRNARFLKTFSLSESVWISVSLSFWAALMVTMPLFIWRLWHFVAVGLIGKERMLGLLFVPVGVASFYFGVLVGYFVGLPLFCSWLIHWNADDPISVYELRLEDYRDFFLLYCGSFGLVLCVPWLVVVICRVGLTTPEQLAAFRKPIIMINAVICAIITPPDPGSMLIMMAAVQALFEVGLVAARIMRWWGHRRIAASENAEH